MSDAQTFSVCSEPVDFLIITALPEERDALLRLLDNNEKVQINGCPTYYLADVPLYGRSESYSVAVTMLSRMGNVNAAQHTTQAITDLKPNYVLMVGIAGGRAGKARLGDVIVATEVLYYEPAKLEGGRQSRHRVYQVDPVLLDRALNYDDITWRSLISMKRPDGRDIEVPKAVFGPIAAGEKVIADADFVSHLITISPKLVGVEMESYGVATAAAHTSDRPRFLSIRGVCDYADSGKNDVWHEYAAASAAAFATGFLRSGPVGPRAGRVEDVTSQPGKVSTLIAIRHQSMEPIAPKAILMSLPPEFGVVDLRELVIDQTDLYQGGRLVDPLEAARRQEGLARKVNEMQASYPGAEIAYYGIAHIPLLFLAGYHLSNKSHLHFFDHSRQTARWDGLQGAGEGPSLELEEAFPLPSQDEGDVIVRVSVSYHVTLNDIKDIVPSSIASLHLRVAEPMIDAVRSERQIMRYSSAFRNLLDEIHERFPDTQRIHLFYSGPAALALNFGRQISKSIHPRIVVYNYFAKDTPKYSWGLDITSEIGENGFLARPRGDERG